MLKHFTFLVYLLFLSNLSIAQILNVQADAGIRVDQATTRHALFRNDTIFLYFGDQLWDGTPGTSSTGLAISTDAPDYNLFTKVSINAYPLYNFHLMPDSVTRRRYSKHQTNDYLISESTTNWSTQSLDAGIRYYLDSSDNRTFGVSTVVVDANADVHIYYIGAMGSVNNIRHCLSTDGGNNFTFQGKNVCGDLNGLGGRYSHLDPFALRLHNNDIRLFTTNANGTVVPNTPNSNANWTVHSFISTDNGMTFTQETTSTGNDTIVSAAMFLDTLVKSLHDPKAVQLPDGRIKIFMNGSTFNSTNQLKWNIHSATSPAPIINNSKEAASLDFEFYPNPTEGKLFLKAKEEVLVQLFDLNGRLLKEQLHLSGFIDIADFEEGVYIVRVRDQRGRELSKILIKKAF